jgi:NADH:ubiquinone oxidoreductase subunit C
MDISFVTGLLRNKLLTTLNALATNITVKNTTDIYIQAESINLEKILTLLALQTNFKLRTLIDIAVLDFPYNTKNRFQCIYLLAS